MLPYERRLTPLLIHITMKKMDDKAKQFYEVKVGQVPTRKWQNKDFWTQTAIYYGKEIER